MVVGVGWKGREEQTCSGGGLVGDGSARESTLREGVSPDLVSAGVVDWFWDCTLELEVVDPDSCLSRGKHVSGLSCLNGGGTFVELEGAAGFFKEVFTS